jgi:signal transduction histidine kinase
VLLAEAEAADQEVEFSLSGASEGIPASHQLAVHRLVQEGLTNARKHAPGAKIRLNLRYSAQATEVELVNERTAAPQPVVPSGYGLIGLAERVAALNGRIEYGRTGSGGWRLAARIPLRGRSGEEEVT